jgi:hypothetical protein
MKYYMKITSLVVHGPRTAGREIAVPPGGTLGEQRTVIGETK